MRCTLSLRREECSFPPATSRAIRETRWLPQMAMPNCAKRSLFLKSCSHNQLVCATCIGTRAGKLPIFSTVACVNCSIVTTQSSFASSMFLSIGFEHWEANGKYLRVIVFKVQGSLARYGGTELQAIC
jgi:hypothetical protein